MAKPDPDKFTSTNSTSHTSSSDYVHDSLRANSSSGADSQRRTFSMGHVLRAVGFILLHQLVMMLVFLLLAAFMILPHMPAAASDRGGNVDQFWTQMQSEMLSPDNTALTSIFTACIIIPLTSLYLKKRRKSVPSIVMTKQPQRKDLTWSLWALVAAQGLSMVWLHFLDWVSQYSGFISSRIDTYQELMGMIADEDVNVALALVSTCVLVPIMEELIYRGVVFGELRQICKVRTALIIQALIFGLIHANFIQTVYAFVLGLVIGYIYEKTQSLPMAFLAHMLFNFLGGGLPILIGEESPAFSAIFILELIALVSLVIKLIYKALKPGHQVSLEDGTSHSSDREI